MDCVVQLDVDIGRSVDARVSFHYDGIHQFQLPATEFGRLCQELRARPYYEWQEAADDLDLKYLDPQALAFTEGTRTMEINLVRATFLIYLLVGSKLTQPSTVNWKAVLADQPLLNERGVPKRNDPCAYFLPADLQARSWQAAQSRLYELNLLAKVVVTAPGIDDVEWYFKPLVVPGVLLNSYDNDTVKGGANYAYWRSVLAAMDSSLRARFPDVPGT